MQLILVDQQDNMIGTEEKMKTHELGLLHRAFSVYVFDRSGKMMIQQRAIGKYHAPGLRANTCCSHQYVGEDNEDACHRRLQEELGFDCPLVKVSDLIYNTPVPPDLIEHEYLHIYVGIYDESSSTTLFNTDEVMETMWIDPDMFTKRIEQQDPTIAPWTTIVWPQVREQLIEAYKELL